MVGGIEDAGDIARVSLYRDLAEVGIAYYNLIFGGVQLNGVSYWERVLLTATNLLAGKTMSYTVSREEGALVLTHFETKSEPVTVHLRDEGEKLTMEQPTWDTNQLHAGPDNNIYDNPADDYADILEDIRVNGIRRPLLIKIDGGVAVIIAGHRRWAVAKKVGMKRVPVTIVPDTYDTLALKQLLVTDNIVQRPKLPWAEYGECHIILSVEEDRAVIRKAELARKQNERLREKSPRPTEDVGRARDMAAATLNRGRLGKPYTGERVQQMAEVYRAWVEAEKAGQTDRAKAIQEAANTGNLSAARRAMKGGEVARNKVETAKQKGSEISELKRMGREFAALARRCESSPEAVGQLEATIAALQRILEKKTN